MNVEPRFVRTSLIGVGLLGVWRLIDLVYTKSSKEFT